MSATISDAMPARGLDRETATYVFETELGWMAFTRGDEGIEALSFGYDTPETAVHDVTRTIVVPRVSYAQDSLARRLQRYAQGAYDDFLDVELALGPMTPFQTAVVERCRTILPGETLSYGQLAEAVGAPRAARAVGNVMRTNRLPILVPCHRVVGSGGALGGYSMGAGLPVKRRLLDLERTCRTHA